MDKIFQLQVAHASGDEHQDPFNHFVPHIIITIEFNSTKSLSKWQFKKVVEKYITKLNKEELLEDSLRYKKIDTELLANEEFKRKPYFNELNLSQVRDRFRIDSQMFGNFKASFPSQSRR